MFFDPIHENLFGAPIGVWIAVAVIFFGPFIGFWLYGLYLDRKARREPPTDS